MTNVTVNNEIYDVQIKLGSGAFGTVYRCLKRSSNNLFAIKFVRNVVRTGHIDEQAIAEELRGVENPYLVKIFDIGSDVVNELLIVMELCDQGSLTAFIPKLQPQPDIETKNIFVHMSMALIFLRSLATPIIHRDVKPDNILIATGSDGRNVYKLTDFGLSRFLAEKGMASTICGTKMYMAPELLDDKSHDHSCDTFSLGMVLLECGLGQYPVADSDFKGYVKRPNVRNEIIRQGLNRVRNSAQLEANFVDVIENMLQVDMQLRPNLSDLIQRLGFDPVA